MTDITKCCGIGCDKKEKCWRYLAPSDEYQYWMSSQECVDQDFEMFWDYFPRQNGLETRVNVP